MLARALVGLAERVFGSWCDLTVVNHDVAAKANGRATSEDCATTGPSGTCAGADISSIVNDNCCCQKMREHAALERLEENQELILAFEEERLQPHEHVDKVSLMLSEVAGTGKE